LTDTYLRKLCEEIFLIMVGLGQEFDSIFTAIFCCGTHRCDVVKLKTTTGVDMTILGRRGAGKDLAHKVDDGIATCSKFMNDFKFPSKFLMVCDGCLLGRRDKTKEFTLEGNSLANNVAGGEDILHMRRYGGASPCGGRSMEGAGNGLGQGSGRKGWRGKGGGERGSNG
jgi:hypothetical protein